MLIKISAHFSKCPGPRRRTQGQYSGEEFRDIIVPEIKKAIEKDEVLTIDFDGLCGLGRGWIEESFGGLVRVSGFSADVLWKHMKLVGREDQDYIDEAWQDILDAQCCGAKVTVWAYDEAPEHLTAIHGPDDNDWLAEVPPYNGLPDWMFSMGFDSMMKPNIYPHPTKEGWRIVVGSH